MEKLDQVINSVTKLYAKKNPVIDWNTWVLAKIERDLNNKIMINEYKEIAQPYYESLKSLFSS